MNWAGHQSLVEWLNETLPYLNLTWEASEEELRACLIDGTVFCNLLNQLSPGSLKMVPMDEMALPRFEVSDLEQGDMIPVLQALKALKASFCDDVYNHNTLSAMRRWSLPDEYHSKCVDHSNIFNDHNTSTRSLFDMLDKLLDESAQKMNVDVSDVFASIMRGIVQVVEQRISNQAENLKNQNILFRVREEKYRSRINVLETLASSDTTHDNEPRSEEEEEVLLKLKKQKELSDAEISKLKQELEVLKETHEKQLLILKSNAQEAKDELEKQLKDSDLRILDSTKKSKELENICEAKTKIWEKKESTYNSFINHQSQFLQDLKAVSVSLKYEVLNIEESYLQDLNDYGLKLRGVADAAKSYQVVVEENRRLYNEIQELKGNIRVYCRIRPFLQGQNKRETSIEYTNENGELVVSNPLKQGKNTHRLFKFNKVFGPASTQDTQPLIRSILDGYNVCIFAYGQTGSGKTYTMNRDVGVTALNEKSSRSHSVLSVHVRGVDVKSEAVLRGSLHLVDLAGSERVDRSQVTGERLKEAQHINKSLSALGDVIFALSHKNPHVPYRNSKLTQVLQNSLGGQAKTLMFVQINPDEESYAETVSTLKFAERVSGVELDVIAKKDQELLKYQNVNGDQKHGLSNLRFESPSPRRHSLGGAAAAASPIAPRRRQGPGSLGRTTSDSANERRNQNESRSSSKFSGGHRV
ncbi:unnamed protein product [Cochlearia groenlandica]